MDPACFVASLRTPDKHTPTGVGYYARIAARTWIIPLRWSSNPIISTAPRPPTVAKGILRDPVGVVSPDIFGAPGRGRKPWKSGFGADASTLSWRWLEGRGRR